MAELGKPSLKLEKEGSGEVWYSRIGALGGASLRNGLVFEIMIM
jgi:hypothetical protein